MSVENQKAIKVENFGCKHFCFLQYLVHFGYWLTFYQL